LSLTIAEAVLEMTSADIASQFSGLDGRARVPNMSVNADAQGRPAAVRPPLGRWLLSR